MDKNYTQLTTTLLEIVRQHITINKVKLRPHDKPWYNNNLRQLKKKTLRLRKHAQHVKTEDAWIKYRQSRNKLNSLIRQTKREYPSKLGEKLKQDMDNPKMWWKTVNALMKGSNTQSLPPMKNQESDAVLTDSEDKANLLNDYFTSQTVLPNEKGIPTPLVPGKTNCSLAEIDIKQDEVRDTLASLNKNKAQGPDKIPPYLLKHCANSLSYPLWKIMKKSLNTGTLPQAWKLSHIKPIFKKGDNTLPENYRPIALTSAVCKVLEKIIFKHLYNFLKQNNLISRYQSGFIPGDGTTNQLVDFTNMIYESFEDKKEIRAIFLDISKAFDRVWIRGLLAKLKSVGIKNKLYQWIEQYLSNRKQRVMVDECFSVWKETRAGVPQGSVLGPLLFLIFINDITDNIKSHIKLFADDTMIFTTVEDPVRAATILNKDLQTIQNWSETWLVNFNAKKTKTITFGTKANKQLHPKLYLNQEEIVEVDSHTHLGLTMSSNGKWEEHISNLIAKTNYKLVAMRKFKHILDRKSLVKIYCSYIRPTLEYASCVWNNCTKAQSDRLEQLQLEAARIVTGSVKGTQHKVLYCETGWLPLSDRRENSQIALLYKMVNHMVPQYLSLLVSRPGQQQYNLRNSLNIPEIFGTNEMYRQSFLPSAVKVWNKLSLDIRQSTSVNSLKNKLNSTKCPKKPPVYYNLGSRQGQIYHARLRMQSSDLNYHKVKRHISENMTCACGAIREDPKHYLLFCPKYQNDRSKLTQILDNIDFPPESDMVNNLLHGNPSLSVKDNETLFEAVIDFIVSTKRFSRQ